KRDKGRAGHRIAGEPNRLRDAAGLELVDVHDARLEHRSVAGGAAYLVAGVYRDDDGDVADVRSDERFDGVEQDGLVGDGDKLLRAGIGERAQAASLAAAEDQSLHGAVHAARS